jgi:hypothetical protein
VGFMIKCAVSSAFCWEGLGRVVYCVVCCVVVCCSVVCEGLIILCAFECYEKIVSIKECF